MKPVVSVIICTLNREEVLCATLRKVVELLTIRNDAELIVVDQTRQHQAATERCLTELAGSIQLHRVEFASLTRARNHGVRHARGDIILFLDDDVEPSLRLIDEHLVCYSNPEVWGVGGCVLLPGKHPLSKSDLTAQEVRDLELGKVNRFDLDWPRMMSWAPGCNMSFRREKLFAVGGFDEAFYGMAIGEETELCFRMHKAGGIIQYSPAAVLVHLVNPEGGCRDARAAEERTAQMLDNAYYMLRRTAAPLIKTWRILLRQCVTIAFNRQSLRKRTWPGLAMNCLSGLRRALAGRNRKPCLPFLSDLSCGLLWPHQSIPPSEPQQH